jgi:3-hydroxyisobutyrate dehydrogenase-like beta-hydroxyacid dehydrogenase
MDPGKPVGPIGIGLVGIGLVGTALAENLLAASFQVIGSARSEASRENLRRLGGRAAGRPGQVAEEAVRVVVSLPDSGVVDQIVSGPFRLCRVAAWFFNRE